LCYNSESLFNSMSSLLAEEISIALGDPSEVIPHVFPSCRSLDE